MYGHEMMTELPAAQQKGIEYENTYELRLDTGKIMQPYPTDRYTGHAAWLDWPWKLHHLEN